MQVSKHVAIKVEDLSKKYIISRDSKGAESFREALMRVVAEPFRRFRLGPGLTTKKE